MLTEGPLLLQAMHEEVHVQHKLFEEQKQTQDTLTGLQKAVEREKSNAAAFKRELSQEQAKAQVGQA